MVFLIYLEKIHGIYSAQKAEAASIAFIRSKIKQKLYRVITPEVKEIRAVFNTEDCNCMY